MAEYKICFAVGEAFGLQIGVTADEGVPYEELAACVNKERLADMLSLDAIGYTADDIKIITPEQYEEEYEELERYE